MDGAVTIIWNEVTWTQKDKHHMLYLCCGCAFEYVDICVSVRVPTEGEGQ